MITWLLIPHIGKRSVKGDSNFLLYLDIARVLAGKGDHVHFLVDGRIDAGDLPAITNVHFIASPEIRGLSYYNRMALLPQRVVEECNRRCGSRFIDIVLTSRPGVVQSVKMALSAIDDAFIPVVYLEPGAEDRLPRPHGGEDYRRIMTQAWAAADVCVALTSREKEVMVESLRRYVSSAEVAEFSDTVFVNPVGVPLEAVDAVRSLPKNETMTLFFGARAKEVKNIDQVVKLYDQVFRSGRKVKILIASPTHERKVVELIGKIRLERNSDIDVNCGLDRSSYLKLAAGAHIFLAASRLEGFPVGFWEQMYLGLIGVFPKRPWAVYGLPEGYPFFYETDEEAYALLTWIVDNYAEAKAKVAFMESLIRERYGRDTVWGALRDRLMPLLEDQYCMGKTFQDLVDDATGALGDEFEFEELTSYMSAQSQRMPAGVYARAEDTKYPGNFDIYRYLLNCGYTYTVKNGTRTIFRKAVR